MYNFNILTDEQLIKLVKMRFEHEPLTNQEHTIVSIRVSSKWFDRFDEYYSVSFVMKLKEWSDERYNLVFSKFYPNEFLYLIECGIDFKNEIKTEK